MMLETKPMVELGYELTGETKEFAGRAVHRIRATRDGKHRRSGALGGWVESLRVGNYGRPRLEEDAWLAGEAVMIDDASAAGEAVISGRAVMRDNSWATGNGRVRCDAVLKDEAWVDGGGDVWGGTFGGEYEIATRLRYVANALVTEESHILAINAIGSEAVTAALVRTPTGHRLSVGCWSGVVDDLMDEVAERREYWPGSDAMQDAWQAQYVALEALCRARISEWTAAPA